MKLLNKLVKILIFGGTMFVVVGLSSRPRTNEKLSVTIGYRPTVVVDLALLQAIESGEFNKVGIDVKLQPYGRADLLFAALKSGEIQGSTGIPLEPLLGMATSGEYPYKGYLVWYFDATTPYDGFLVRNDSSINSIKELDGKVIGSHPSKQVKYFVTRMLPNAKVMEYNPASPLLSLQSGDLDAVYVLEPNISQAVSTGEFRLIEASCISKYIFNGMRIPAALSILSSKWIGEHPIEARTFVEIARNAYEKDQKHRNTKDIEKLLSKKEFGGYSSQVASHVVEPSSTVPEDLDRDKLDQFFNMLRKGNLLNGTVDIDKLLYIPHR